MGRVRRDGGDEPSGRRQRSAVLGWRSGDERAREGSAVHTATVDSGEQDTV